MPLQKMNRWASKALEELSKNGTLKGQEDVIEKIQKPVQDIGPRYFIKGEADREFIKMDSNSYLGLSLHDDVIQAEENASREFGVGPGSVRFIHGTYRPHIELEKKLASFHAKEAAIIYSSAYSAVCGILSPLISPETIVISDELNHNCIINGIRIAKPQGKEIYSHLDMDDLEAKMKKSSGHCRRLLVVTDGVFSMRGDYPDLRKFVALAKKYNEDFEEGIVTVMDDSHGTGAYGETGRGTCEITHEFDVDIIVSTLGKSLGVNGGYAVTSHKIVKYLRETSPFYIYSNPITPGEAAAALQSLIILDSSTGKDMLKGMRKMVTFFKDELRKIGYEVLEGEHPIVAVMIRDGQKTTHLVDHLKKNGVLAVGLKYPVVPKGDECIRFQIGAAHTPKDIEHVLSVVEKHED